MKIFKTKDELLEQLKIDCFGDHVIELSINQNSMEDIFKNFPTNQRVDAIVFEYEQFIDYCKWDELSSLQWAYLLGHRPEFSKYCNWDKLDSEMDSENWIDLLVCQPQFYKHFHLSKLNGYDWCYLLKHQPQFAKYCDWDKLDRQAWISLLTSKRRPHCYPSTNKLTDNDWDFIIRWNAKRQVESFEKKTCPNESL